MFTPPTNNTQKQVTVMNKETGKMALLYASSKEAKRYAFCILIHAYVDMYIYIRAWVYCIVFTYGYVFINIYVSVNICPFIQISLTHLTHLPTQHLKSTTDASRASATAWPTSKKSCGPPPPPSATTTPAGPPPPPRMPWRRRRSVGFHSCV